jgi:WD40 repeat protein
MDQHMQDFNARHLLMLEEAYQTEIAQLSRTVDDRFQSQQALITAQQATIARLESLVSAQRLAISRLEEKLGSRGEVGVTGEDVAHNDQLSVAVIPGLPASGPCITTLRGHRYDVNAVLVSEADHRLYSGSNDATIKIWNTLTYQCIATLEGHFANVRCLALSYGRKRLYSASEEILVWDIETFQTVHSFRSTANRAISYLLVEESANRLFAASYDTTVIVWDLDSYQCLHTLEGHAERVECLCLSLFLSPPRLYSGSMDTCIRVWNTTTMRPAHNLQGHTGNVYSLCLSEDETRLYSGSNDKSIKVWDTVTNTCLVILRGHTNTVFSLCLSFRTKQLISAGSSGQQIKIWDADTHRCVNTFEEAHENIIWSIALADSNGVIYSASKDKTIKTWKL